jgi:outer membrane receptor protein involved in Fe transport
VQARFRRGAFEGAMLGDWFDGESRNLLNGLPFQFTTGVAQASFGGRHVLGTRAVMGWGTELRRSTYDLSLAEDGEVRRQAAVFSELDLELLPRLWLTAAGRVDHVEETVGTVFSPRAALRIKPTPDQTLRVAWGEAFRAPSVIESDLAVSRVPLERIDWREIDEEIVGFPFFTLMAEGVCSLRPDHCGAPPGEIPTYTAVVDARGSRELRAEVTESVELGYVGRFGPFDLSAAVYRSRSDGGIAFDAASFYGMGPDGLPATADDVVLPQDPDGDGIEEAPAVDVCPFGLDLFPPFDELCPLGPVPYNTALSILLDGRIPALAVYETMPVEEENRGAELGFAWHGRSGLSVALNYSWQDDPRTDGAAMAERRETFLREVSQGVDLDGDGVVADTSEFVNVPAENRISVSVDLDRRHFFGAVSLDRVDETFWQDVGVTPEFWGDADGYSLVGLRAGWRWPAHGVELTGQVTNLLDDDIQQHIFGDVIGRRATVGLTWTSVPQTKESR